MLKHVIIVYLWLRNVFQVLTGFSSLMVLGRYLFKEGHSCRKYLHVVFALLKTFILLRTLWFYCSAIDYLFTSFCVFWRVVAIPCAFHFYFLVNYGVMFFIRHMLTEFSYLYIAFKALGKLILDVGLMVAYHSDKYGDSLCFSLLASVYSWIPSNVES